MQLRIGSFPVTRGEVSGALADLGVLLPLEAALIAVNGLSPTATLLGVGVIYIAVGWYFRLPMPVQPLKALSVIAIAQALSPSVIAAGALLMAATMLTLSLTRAVEHLNRVVPLSVVRGVQFSLGVLLIRNALTMMLDEPFLVGGSDQLHLFVGEVSLSAGVLVGIGGLALLAIFLWSRVLPAAAMVVAAGVVLGLLVREENTPFSLGPAQIGLMLPAGSDFSTALVVLVIPQLPLTLTNSVIATVDTARSYFGERARRVTATRVSLAIALGNLWAGLAGGLPNCHGSGGLTAHYRLGARTPVATTIIGGLLIAIALLFGKSALAVRSLMPFGILGALLFYVGIQHLLLGLKVAQRRDLAVVLLVGAVAASPWGNLAIGAGVGLVVEWIARGVTRVVEQRRRAAAVVLSQEGRASDG